MNHCLVFVAKASLPLFNHAWFLTHYRIVKVVLLLQDSLRLSPPPTLQRVDDSLGEATVFG